MTGVRCVRQHRPGAAATGRLVMMVWQAHERNEWDFATHQALGQLTSP
jgi:hypothetical protein